MDKMQAYSCRTLDEPMVPEPQGQWYRRQDVEREIEQLRAERDAYRDAYREVAIRYLRCSVDRSRGSCEEIVDRDFQVTFRRKEGSGEKGSYVLFDKPPGPESPQFIEVEREGCSINAGEWVQQEDGLWRLYLDRLPEIVDTAEEIEQLRAIVEDRNEAISVFQDVVERLRAEVKERTKAARYIACVLGGASDSSPGRWGRKEVRNLFAHVCREWPWADPREAAEAAEAAEGEIAGVRECPDCHCHTLMRDTRVGPRYWCCSNPGCPGVDKAAEKGVEDE